MKKFFNSKYGEAIILTAASVLSLLFTLILYSVKVAPKWGEKSLWSVGDLENYSLIIGNVSSGFIFAFCVVAVALAVSVLLTFLLNKKWVFYISVSLNAVLNLVLLFFHIFVGFLRSGALACLILSLVFSVAQLTYMGIRNISYKKVIKEETPEFIPAEELSPLKPKTRFIFKTLLLAIEGLTALLAFIAFFVPLYSLKYEGVLAVVEEPVSVKLIQALSVNYTEEGFSLALYIAFIVMFIAFFANLMALIASLPCFIKSESAFVKKSKKSVYGNVVFLLVFFILGFALTFYNNVVAENFEKAVTLSYIPLLCALPLLIGFSVIQGRMGYEFDGEKILDGGRKLRVEPLIYVILLTAITFVSLVLNVIEINFSVSIYFNTFEENFSITGYKLLSTYGELGSGLQILAFVLFVMLLISGMLLVFTAVSYFTKYRDYGKVIKTAAISNAIFVLLFGLSGLYFKIAQAINIENIESILNQYGQSLPSDMVYKVSSKTIYMFIASFVVLLVMLIRGQLNAEAALSAAPASAPAEKVLPAAEAVSQNRQTGAPAAIDFDACPAFTELDYKIKDFDAELKKRRENEFENLTLPNLVRFVVDYARECRLHLSYSLEDMATFVAGLGASRLTILQGMSGTGKTSLPKIFAEAIMGNCEIVEVESSWRDKNELLGYYNEFSKCFTPKKFTQCLYKARLNSDVPTFIVLDEMNLSRIEYYFSDFLSLMEHEEDKREIKLLNVKLFRGENGEKISYRGLTDGHTIKIPANVWFIGTANRDESTFEISDKVYDRAQTMNFYKRAPKIHAFGEPLQQRFTAYDKILELFEKAKNGTSFDAENNLIIQKVEKLLIPFNISFGNRILRQMEDFVKIYCACFNDKDGVLNEAVEKIMLSKVVCKLEYKIVENKEALAAEFDKLGLLACSAFIRRLNED